MTTQELALWCLTNMVIGCGSDFSGPIFGAGGAPSATASATATTTGAGGQTSVTTATSRSAGGAGAGGQQAGGKSAGGEAGAGGQVAPCTHDPCAVGEALLPDCAPCVTSICGSDPSCCDVTWAQYCVEHGIAAGCGC